MIVASLVAWMGEALEAEAFASSPRLFILFACRFAMDAASLSLVAIALARVVGVYPAWNKACKSVLGRSWGSLLMARKSAAGAAHPGELGFALCCAVAASMCAAANWVGGREGEDLAKWAASSGSTLAWMLVHEVFIVAIYSLMPLLAVNHALKDGSSQLGGTLQALLGDKAGMERARCEEQALDKACGQGEREDKHSKERRRL